MIEGFVKRPATTVIFVAFFVVLGLVSYFNLNLERTPSIDFPLVTVKVVYPGATPEEVEVQVVKKVEDAVSEISEIKKITSKAYENYGFVLIEFLLGADVNVKAMEVKDKVDAIVNDLPDAIDKPLVEKYDPLATPVMELILSSESIDTRDLYEFADKKLKNRVAAISGIAKVDLYGGRIRQINVKLDPMLMKKYFVSIGDVISAMARKNMNVPGGVIDKKEDSFSVRFLGEFLSVEEISQMKLVSNEGRELTLGDIGIVEDSFKKLESMARFNGKEVVGLSIIKVSDGNEVKIAKELKKRLPQIKELLPKGSNLEIASDNSIVTEVENASTEKNILLGIILTIIILYLFTGQFSITFIAAIIIPTSIVSSFFLIEQAAFTINMMTLLAIATALGTLIANAIVIIENVLARMDKGDDAVSAAINGTKEVTIAVLASAGTNLVVFTPIAFMGGIVGKFMQQFGLTVVFATVFSLIASFSLTPMMCAQFLKRRKSKENKGNIVIAWVNKGMKFLLAEYKLIFDLLFRYPKATVLLCLASLIFCFPLLKYVGNDFMSPYDEDKIIAYIKMPQGTTIDSTRMRVQEVEQIVSQVPEVKSYLSEIGENGVENATMIITLIPYTERERSDLDVINYLIPALAKIPDLEINLGRGDPRGGSDYGDIVINVYGIEYDEMIVRSRQMVQIMQESGFFRSVELSYKDPKDEIRFIPDQDRMTDSGIPNALVAQALRASIYGDDTNIYKENGEEYKINVELTDEYKGSLEDLSQINIISRKGMLPITALGEVAVRKAMPSIDRRDKERVIAIQGLLAKSTSGEVQRILDNGAFKEIGFKPGYGYRYVGMSEHQQESQREIAKAFVLASILTYMILAAILNSFVHPVTIASSIIMSLSGVILFLFFLGHSINIGSMMAIIMLVGLVVNNAILMLDVAINKIQEGVDIVEALWLGVSEKFRVIMMTSIAIIFSTLPQLASNNTAKAAMAAVIMGGMLASIIFTFVLIPVVFWYLERLRRIFIR